MRYLLLTLILSVSLHAQLPDPELTAADRRQIAEAFAARVETSYVLAEPAKKIAAAIRENIRKGEYDNVTPASAFSERLVRDARAVQNDRHLRVAVASQVIPADYDGSRPPGPEQKKQFANEVRRSNFGVTEVKRMEGNVGYVDIEVFPPLEFAKTPLDGAILYLANTDALIIDARRHRGGDPETVAYLVSWFVPEGTVINETFTRSSGEKKSYIAGKLPGPRYDKKVYVLTSKRTFSGGEELAYDFQALKRGTLFGEVTGGGAHPTGAYRIHDRFFAYIPHRQSINPVTKTNWEGVGVKPDVAVAADDALKVAHEAALKDLGMTSSAEVTPARELLEAWVKSFNEHDLEARKTWLLANAALSAEQAGGYAKMDVEIREQQGPFDLLRFGKVTATSAEAFARHRKSGNGARISVELDPSKKKIGQIGLEAADVPKGNS
jgi:Peptidase family S41